MSIEQFDQTRFGASMKANYGGIVYPITSVDFEEKLIGLDLTPDQQNSETQWVRCENVELVTA